MPCLETDKEDEDGEDDDEAQDEEDDDDDDEAQGKRGTVSNKPKRDCQWLIG